MKKKIRTIALGTIANAAGDSIIVLFVTGPVEETHQAQVWSQTANAQPEGAPRCCRPRDSK